MASYAKTAKLARIQLPTGTTYALVDQDGREMIASKYETGVAYSKGSYVWHTNPNAGTQGIDGLFRINNDISASSNTGWTQLSTTGVTVGEELKAIKAAIVNPMHYLGKTTTALSDNATTSPITVDGSSIVPTSGDITIYSGREFIFDGQKWNEFGSTGSLGDMAFADTASGHVTVTNSDATTTVGIANTVNTVTTKYLKASASGGAVSAATNNSAIATLSAPTSTFLTGLGTPTTADAITELDKSTNTFLTGLGDASKSDAVTGLGTPSYKTLATETVSTVSAKTDHSFKPVTTMPISGVFSTSVSGDTLTIGWTAPTPGAFGTEITCSEITTGNKTLATGSLVAAAASSASTVMVSPGTPSTSKFVTGYNAPSSTTALTSVGAKSTATVVKSYPGATGSAVTSVSAATSVNVPATFTVTNPTITLSVASSTDGSYTAANPVAYVSAVSTKTTNGTVTYSKATGGSVTVTPDNG